ncbi:MAG: hypothetical protein U0271_25275 [Polyangiaceae bacterium]
MLLQNCKNWAALIGLSLLVACSSTGRSTADDGVDVRVSAAPASSVAREPIVSAREPVVAARECRSDDDCAWDDPCLPLACAPGRASLAKCLESRPPPGECGCLAGRCAIVYKPVPISCDEDGECEWRPACTPTACGAADDNLSVCNRSSDPPGVCACLDHVCAGIVRPRLR